MPNVTLISPYPQIIIEKHVIIIQNPDFFSQTNNMSNLNRNFFLRN